MLTYVNILNIAIQNNNLFKRKKPETNMKKKGSRTDGDITRAAMIAIILSGDTKISDIEKKLELDRPTIYHHLKVLEEMKLIKREKDKSAKGQPVKITAIPNKNVIKAAIDAYEKEISEAREALKKLRANYKKM